MQFVQFLENDWLFKKVWVNQDCLKLGSCHTKISHSSYWPHLRILFSYPLTHTHQKQLSTCMRKDWHKFIALEALWARLVFVLFLFVSLLILHRTFYNLQIKWKFENFVRILRIFKAQLCLAYLFLLLVIYGQNNRLIKQ